MENQQEESESAEEVELHFEADRLPVFETEDPFEDHVMEENEFEYEPEGAFLD